MVAGDETGDGTPSFHSDANGLMEGRSTDVRWMRSLADGRRRSPFAGFRETRTFLYLGISVFLVLTFFLALPQFLEPGLRVGGVAFEARATRAGSRIEFEIRAEAAAADGSFAVVVVAAGAAFEGVGAIGKDGGIVRGALHRDAEWIDVIVSYGGESASFRVDVENAK